MITIKESTREDMKNIQRLWADGDVMKFVGFPEGLHETDEALLAWLDELDTARPGANHYSIYDDGEYCGETNYAIDGRSGTASLDIKPCPMPSSRPFSTARKPSGSIRPRKTGRPSPSTSAWALCPRRCRSM